MQKIGWAEPLFSTSFPLYFAIILKPAKIKKPCFSWTNLDIFWIKYARLCGCNTNGTAASRRQRTRGSKFHISGGSDDPFTWLFICLKFKWSPKQYLKQTNEINRTKDEVFGSINFFIEIRLKISELLNQSPMKISRWAEKRAFSPAQQPVYGTYYQSFCDLLILSFM